MAYTKEQMASAAGVIDSGKGVNKKVNVSNESLSAGSYEGAMARREASGGRVGDGRYDKDAYVYRPETNTFYDTEAVQKAKVSFTNWMTAGKGANNKNWGYDMSDPEDVNRYYSGQISKKYEAGYGKDSFSQWLKENGLPQADYFDSKYYKDAYASVLADRVEKQKAKNFKKAVAREAWSTASDPMNITGDDIAAAAQRIQLSNPIYKDIELYNPKDSDSSYDSYLSPALAEQTAQAKEQKNRTGKLSLDDVMSDIARYQNRENVTVQKAQEQEETVKTQNIINTAIADSGYSVEIDKRVGLARDSKLNEYNNNKQKKQAASDSAIAAMREAGYSNQDIQKAIRQDGRLSYSESTEGKANEAERIARRDSSDATSAKILNGMDSFTQGAVDKAKKLGNMGTSSQKGFSPISMMEGYGLSEQETRAVNSYIDTATAVLEAQGYEPLEIDNALRRADLGEYIPKERARVNYSTYTLKECGLTDEQIQQVLATYTEEDWKNTDKDMLASDYVENSMADQLANSIISMPIRAALSIACGAEGVLDMGAATISGRAKLWKFTDELQDMSAWWTQFSHDRNHKVISTAADVGAEIMRMRATSLIGSALTPAATTTSSSAAGTDFLFNFMQKNASHLPFISGAIGNYYLEAVNGGATPRMAALYAIPAGALEGYLESLEMGEVLQHSFGMNIIGKKIAASGLSANFKQFAITKGMPFVNFALGTIGEGLEEAASYYGSSIARMATWDKGYEMDFSEMWDNAKGGLLIGGIMNGLSMGAHTQSYKYASEIYKGTGGNYAAYLDSFMSAMHMENMNDVQRQALIDKYNSGEINVSRDAAINAGVEIQTNAEVVAAKKQAVESAENDAAVKVENANNKVTQAEQRLAGIDDPDPVKKGKKIAQASRELSAAKAAASKTASEGQKKVDTATADYKSEAAKAKRKNAANQQLVDEYHASKYCSDIERDAVNAPVGGSAADPAANTNADANTAQNGIDNIKNGVAQGDNRGFDARGNEIEYELNDEAKETLAQKYMTPEIQAHIAAMMEMPQTIDDNSPERQQYRIAKADEYYDKYQAANKNREAYIVIGPPAAGKSTIADPLVERTGSILIDSDIIKMGDKARGFEGIPEYGDGIGANAVHEESAQIADGIFVKAIAHGDNLVYPKVGGSAKSIRELAQQLKKHGYTTTLILNELPIEKALERNNNRYNETGRLVRPDYLLSVGNKPIKTYLELQGEGVFDGYERYSNDVNRGEAPFRVLEADKERPVVLRRGGSGRQTSDGDIIETGRADSRGEGTEVAPQFSPALKDLGANTPSPVEMKQSKVYTNTYDKWLTEAEKSADSVENSMYAVSREADTLSNAREIVRGAIENDGNLDGAMRRLNHCIWDATDVDTAMLIGETLRSEAAETGDYTKLNDWKKEIQRHMTESGQAIQALAKWTRDSSVGAEAALDKAVADINRKNQKAIDKGKMAPIEVDPELLNELRSAQTRKERDAVMDRIAVDIGSKVPTGVIDKINSWRYLSMLGNPRTILRNLIGNEIMSDVMWTGKDAIGTLLEKGIDKSQRTKAIPIGEEYQANKAYAETTLDDARRVLLDSSRYDTKTGIERAIDDNRRVFNFKPIEEWRKATDWALSEGDVIFLERQYKRSFAQMMIARGYSPDTMTAAQRSECMSYAINEAKRSTFHDTSKVADALTKLENKNTTSKLLVGGVVPFKKTPLNVLARGVDFSPIGLMEGIYQTTAGVKSGNYTAAQGIDRMASGLAGSSLMALGLFLAKSGIITGGNDDEDKYYKRDLGYQDFALNLGGGKSVTIDWAVPATIPLFMGVALYNIAIGDGAEGENALDAALNTLAGIADPLVEMSMLQGLQDTLEAAGKASENRESFFLAFGKNATISYASQFIPTVGGQIARTIDPVRRDTAGDPNSALGKTLDKATNKMQAKIPLSASGLQPYINVWGEQEINEHSWPVRLLEQAILPGYLDGVDMTPVDVELTRLYSVTQDKSVVPSNYPYRTLKDDKTKDRYILSADEYTAFKIDNGRAMYAAAEDAINSPQYQRMDDDEKASFVAKAIDDAQRDILRKYKKKYLNQK